MEAGDVTDESSLTAWLRDLVDMGVGRSDAIRSATPTGRSLMATREAFGVVNDLALALAPSAELYLETSQQGRSFLDATASAWPSSRLPRDQRRVAYPAAVGSCRGGPLHSPPTTLEAFLFAFVQNMIRRPFALRRSARVRERGSRASLRADVEAMAREAEGAALDDIASSTFRVDLGSFHHETQYTRIFRS